MNGSEVKSLRVPVVGAAPLWDEDVETDVWISSHGYESRSIKHVELPRVAAKRMLSVGYEFPEGPEVEERLATSRSQLQAAGYEIHIGDDEYFERLIREAVLDFRAPPSVVAAPRRVTADISSMNRTRIAALLLACAAPEIEGGCDLELRYFPSTFASHKHAYEPLEVFGPVHHQVAGWAGDPDLPLALVVGLGTEPSRAEGIVETVEPDILSLFEPIGDEPEFSEDVQSENRRVLDVGGEPTIYSIRDPEHTVDSLHAVVGRLAERARVVIVPLGPKLFCALSVAVALRLAPEVGVWKASAGRGVQPVNVEAVGEPVIARFQFR